MLRSVWRQLAPFLPSGRWRIALISALSLGAALAEAVVLIAVVNVALLVAEGGDELVIEIPLFGEASLEPAVVLVVACGGAIVSLVCHILVARLSAAAAAETIRVARSRATRAYADASWGQQALTREGSLQQTTTTLAHQSATLTYQMAQLLAAAVALSAMFVVATVVDLVATLVVVSLGATLFFLLRPVTQATKRRARRFVRVNSAFAEEITAWTRMAMELRAFGVEDVEVARLEALSQDAATSFFKARFANRLGAWLYRDAAQILLVAGVAAIYFYAGDIQLATVGVVVLLILRSLTYATQIQSSLQEISEYAPNLEEFVRRTEALESRSEKWGSRSVESVFPIEFVDVSYRYEDGRVGVDSLDLQFRPGEILGVIGASGSGKSTLVQLLLRLRSPTTGRIEASGVDYREIDSECWRQKVSIVAQEPRLFEASIIENIRFHRSGFDSSEVRRAAREAHVYDEMELLDDGFDTVLGARGAGLSGGQSQRLSIARALLARPELLVLDEPTSALDVRSERLIQETMQDLKVSMSIVLIAHRLSTLEICDRVVVMERGRVKFVGPREDALAVADFGPQASLRAPDEPG